MNTWVLIVVMKFGLSTAAFETTVVDGFGSKQYCESAAEQIKDDAGYKRHMCIEVKK